MQSLGLAKVHNIEVLHLLFMFRLRVCRVSLHVCRVVCVVCVVCGVACVRLFLGACVRANR
jgi:hypothetical protein